MAFTFDFLDDGRVLAWESTPDGPELTVDSAYTPRFYVGSRSPEATVDFSRLRTYYEHHPHVVATTIVERRPGFRRDYEPVLAVDVERVESITRLAHQAQRLPEYPMGELAFFNVDFSREFRYCLENHITPTPAGDLSTLQLSIPLTAAGRDAYTQVSVDGETVHGSPRDILKAVQVAVDDRDPDVLVCSTSEVIPTLYAMADAVDLDFTVSRWPDVDYQQLAGRSTYSSYGRVGHSPARYNVPGRAIIDESNTFFYGETNLEGVIDLVTRSRKPVQELAWASIGNVLTAIQICEADRRDVLTPWHSWRHEFFKPMGTLHDADRGGFVFSPEVGLHEEVHELDFSSLYPNIICTRNVSPDSIRCECHRNRDDVPGLGYSLCDEQGFLVDVLQPLVDARDDLKAEIRRENIGESPDKDLLAELEGRSAALKWILVACFGYQGFSNAKFGRIECHEAINAFAREILLTAKDRLEAGGWRVLHGIVDSVWVTPDPDVSEDARVDLAVLAERISDEVGIRLEYEAEYDWVAFVPQRESDAGALTKYFGKVAGEDDFKMGYARQDQAFEPGQPVSARAVARAISTGTDRVLTVNPHEAAVLDFFDVPATAVDAAPRLADPLPADLSEPVFLAPDESALGLADAVRDGYGTGATDYFEKVRHSGSEVSVTPSDIDVTDRDVVVVDDIVATGSTMSEAIGALDDPGRVFVTCVHPLLAGNARLKLATAGVEAVHGTDTLERAVSSVSAAPVVADEL